MEWHSLPRSQKISGFEKDPIPLFDCGSNPQSSSPCRRRIAAGTLNLFLLLSLAFVGGVLYFFELVLSIEEVQFLLVLVGPVLETSG